MKKLLTTLTLICAAVFSVQAQTSREISVSSFTALRDSIATYDTATVNVIINVMAPLNIDTLLIIPANAGRTLTIRSENALNPVTLTRDRVGNLFTVNNNATLILENITINGGRPNNGGGSLVRVNSGGTLVVDNGAILQNNNSAWAIGGGVYVSDGGTFTMTGGEISGNNSNSASGGVFVNSGGTFTMNGGKISQNSSIGAGGGVFVSANSTFTMNGGEISGNSSASSLDGGGGVFVSGGGIFTMNGGEISKNTSNSAGSGVLVNSGSTFRLGGTAVISGNTRNGVPNNVFLNQNQYILFSPDSVPRAGMNVGITTATPGGIFVNGSATAERVQNFFADDTTMRVILFPAGVLLVAPPNTVTIDRGAIINDTANGRFFAGDTVRIRANPPSVGRKFVNWTATPLQQVVFANRYDTTTTFIMPLANVAVTAVFEAITYNITYRLNGGTGNMQPTSFTVETPTITLPMPTRSGFTFGGWFDNAGLTGSSISQIQHGDTGHKEFWAKWDTIIFTITYVMNGGINHPDNPHTFTIETPTIILQEPTREGFTFSGWAEGNSIPQGSIGNRIFTAQWFSVSITGPNPICIGQTTQLQTSINNGTWSSNNDAVASVDPITGLVTGLSSGTATFTFTEDGTGFRVTTPLIAVSSDRAPTINNGISVRTDLTGTPYLLTFPNIAGNFFYQWYHNETPIAGANSQFFYAANGLQHGEYRVFVAYARSESCGRFSDPITIGSQPTNASQELFFLYPNPSDGRFTVVFNRNAIGNQTAVTIGLFSLQGAKIMEQQVVGSENFEINENLNRGIYVLRVTTDSNLSETKQIIINN